MSQSTSVVFSEPMRAGEYLVSEGNGYQSREVGVIAAAAVDCQPGTVLGKITATGKFVLLNPAAADGSQNAAAILYGYANVSTAGGGSPPVPGDVQRTITVRQAEVNGLLLIWPAGITAAQQAAAIAQLNAQMIEVRT